MANGLPQLNTGGINIIPGIQAGMQMRQMQQQNFLNQKKIANYDEDREWQKKLERSILYVRATDAAIKTGGTPDQMKSVFKSITGEDAGFDIMGPDIEIKYPDGASLTGPREVIAEASEQIAKNPKYLEDPKTWKYLASQGVKIEAAESMDRVKKKAKARAEGRAEGTPPKETTEEKEQIKLKYKKEYQEFLASKKDKDDWGEVQVAGTDDNLKEGTVYIKNNKDGNIKILDKPAKPSRPRELDFIIQDAGFDINKTNYSKEEASIVLKKIAEQKEGQLDLLLNFLSTTSTPGIKTFEDGELK